MNSQTFKIKGVHKKTGKPTWFTIKEYSYSQAVKALARKNPNYEFPEIYD